MSLLFERYESVIAQRNMTTLAALRLRDVAARDRLPHAQKPLLQIHVFPAQREKLALPQSGTQRYEDHPAPLTISSFDESIGFVEVEEIKIRLRRTQPLDLRDHVEEAFFAKENE